MKNYKKTIKTEHMAKQIKMYVYSALKLYNENNENWRINVNMANYSIKTLALFAIKENANFSDAWDELMEATNFKSLYRISEIADLINNLT